MGKLLVVSRRPTLSKDAHHPTTHSFLGFQPRPGLNGGSETIDSFLRFATCFSDTIQIAGLVLQCLFFCLYV